MTTCFDSLERLVARDHPGVAEKGRTLAYVHGTRRPRAVVLLHGMSASPAQFERVAGSDGGEALSDAIHGRRPPGSY